MSEGKKLNVYGRLMQILDNGERAVLLTSMGQCNIEKNVLSESQLFKCGSIYASGLFNFEQSIIEGAKEALETGNINFIKKDNEGYVLIEPYFPEPKLVICGGGHISKPLVEFGSRVGFRVTVVDDRLSFANKERFPLAEKVIYENFESFFGSFKANDTSFIVIVTRGHRHDLFCLKETLKHTTAYVGMIGSKRRINIVKEQLRSEGYTEGQLQRINAPIGVEIDAVTPEEIAISIVAQLISFRRKKKTTAERSCSRLNWPELDRTVIHTLSEDKNEAKALATIVSTKGSVPRKAGAKMIIYPDGRIIGSIGGGCSEAEVIQAARDIIVGKGYALHNVDMTGYIAEDEGMACGGKMEILIESHL